MMKIMYNGIVRDMTPEEVEEYNRFTVPPEAPPETPTPSPEERMANLETDVNQMKSEMDDLGYILTGEVLSNAQ